MEVQFDNEHYQIIAQCVRVGDYRRLEDLWLDMCDKPDVDVDALCKIARMLAEKGQTDRAGTLLKMMLPPLAERGEHARGFEAARLVVEYARDPEEVREFAAEAYAKAMAGRSSILAALDVSGIRRVTPLKEAIRQLDCLLFVDEGDYVFHDGGWGVGKIASVNIDEQAVIVDFKQKSGHRMSSAMAPKILRRLEPDDFEVLRWVNPDRLREMAVEEPAAILRSVLRSAGRKLSTKEIKSRLADTVVDSAGWARWWTTARRQAQKDAYIEATGQSFVLRDEAVTPEQSALSLLRSAGTLVQRMTVAIDFLKKSDQADRSAEGVTEMAELIALFAADRISLPEKIEAAFLVDDLTKAGASAPEGLLSTPTEMLADVENLPSIINGMDRGDFQRRALRIVHETRPDAWPGIYEEVLFDSPRDLWDFIIRELLDSDHGALANDACLRVAGDHSSHAELYLWLCRSAFAGRFEAILGEHDEFILLENLLSLLDELADPRRPQQSDAKKLLGRGKDVLAMKNYGHLDTILAACTEDEARRIRDMVTYNRGLSDPTRRSVTGVLMQRHPALFERATAKEEDQPIFTTPSGLKKVQDEYDRLVNVDVPANQRALGTAIDFGDVSDNAELRAAREEQAALARRAEHLSTQLARVVILDRSSVNTEHVSPGTRVLLKNLGKNTEETYTIMGPWDADPDQGIISHLAPLAAALLGKEVGETAEAQLADEVRNYEILGIARADW